MSNPWLKIPLDDYEGHMSLPSVGQSRFIADQFEQAIKECSPKSVAIIGCAGGNGLERISHGQLDRVVAVDVNPEYVERTRVRHAHRLNNLELHCGDIQSEALRFESVDLTFAALLFRVCRHFPGPGDHQKKLASGCISNHSAAARARLAARSFYVTLCDAKHACVRS